MRHFLRIGLCSLAAVFLLTFFIRESQAIPAWSRKYNADCSMCHYPNPPRLNTLGHEFRRAGFRMPDEFNKDPGISNVGEYVSLRTRPRLVYINPDVGNEDFEFQLNDITFFYAGPIASHVSAFTEVEFEDEEETTLLAQISGIWGKSGNYWTLRTGQAHTLARVGFGGFDRPTGISTTALQADAITEGGVPFRINRDQRFLEATYVRGWSRIIFQVLNGIDPAGFGNKSRNFDFDNDKDFSVVYERILDDKASGFTVYSYYGNFHDGILPDRYRFYRYGFTANKILGSGFELQGGYIRANDNLPSIKGNDITGNAFYIDVEKYFQRPNFTIFGRVDYLDGDDDISDNARRSFMLGFAKDLVNNTRLAAEGAAINNQAKDTTDYRFTAEVMVNF